MSATLANGKAESAGKQGDMLLWVGGALVAVLGGTWLALTQPWSSGNEAVPASASETSAEAVLEPAPSVAGAEPQLGTALDNPLRMAQLAFEAGMLIEPEEYSAWALYRTVLQSDPGNGEARAGLMRVADELVRRAQSALEQGRFADAQSIADRILAALPAHNGATDLRVNLTGLAPRSTAMPGRDLLVPSLTRPEITARATMPTVEPAAEPAPEPARPAAEPARASEPAPARQAPQVDRVAVAFGEFETALAGNRLLTPLDGSAKHFAAVLRELDATHERTIAAHAQLSAAFLSRATQALATLDTAAANTWIDEAELLGVDTAGVGAARSAVTDRLAAMEAARPLPASELTLVDYVAPAYPERALARGLEGWVDVEFTVAADGTTRNVTVTGASHDSVFRREAAAAVERWQFAPRSFMGRTIEQRSYTRIRFVQ